MTNIETTRFIEKKNDRINILFGSFYGRTSPRETIHFWENSR